MIDKQGNERIGESRALPATFSEPSLVPLQPATAEDPLTSHRKRGPPKGCSKAFQRHNSQHLEEGVRPQGSGSSSNGELCTSTPVVFLGGALTLTSCSAVNFCHGHPRSPEPSGGLDCNTGGRGGALSSSQLRAITPLLLPSNSLPTRQTQGTSPSNEIQGLAQEDLGDTSAWLSAEAMHTNKGHI